jgi:hypothetical protein
MQVAGAKSHERTDSADEVAGRIASPAAQLLAVCARNVAGVRGESAWIGARIDVQQSRKLFAAIAEFLVEDRLNRVARNFCGFTQLIEQMLEL